MTTNRAWSRRVWPDHHVAVDYDQYKLTPAIYHDLSDMGRLFVCGSKWPCGVNIPFNLDDRVVFSHDLEQGVVESVGQCGSVVYVALQLAAYMGYGPLYVIGLDLSARRYDGSASPDGIWEQNNLFRHAAMALTVNVWNLSPGSRCDAFPKKSFAEALPDMNWMYREKEIVIPPQPDMAVPQ